MKKLLLPLVLAAATAFPLAALADDPTPPAPPQLSQSQREAMWKTMESFHSQAEQLHKQLRAQVLGALTPAHRTAIASIVGNLAIASNPDPEAAAKQIDAVLSQAEQQRIVAAHTAFRTQAKALHEQMRAQMEKMMPAMPDGMQGHGPMPPMGPMGPMGQHESDHHSSDPGMLVLKILSGHDGSHMEMMHHGWEGGPPRP